tara:strand:+ start:22 stop:219 length:198 start_codon:yes stop_codon:yes gene_type:complete
MKILREINGYKLNEGNSMASGLCNVSKDEGLSFWFDSETKDELMDCNEVEFQEKSESLIVESLVE